MSGVNRPGRAKRGNASRSGVLLALLAAALLAYGGTAAGRTNDPVQADRPYVVLVSIDGFRWDFPDRYGTPALDRLEREGARAAALHPVFPTLTFPNHYSIATGVYPWRHGIVANEFPDETGKRWYNYKDRDSVQDGSWYLAEPVWVTAEKQGLVTAAYFFVGTEAPVNGIRPTYWRPFVTGVSGEERVRQVLEWLSLPPDTRPHLVTLYFEQVDDVTHWNGVGSPESAESIRAVDHFVGALLDGIDRLSYSKQVYIVLVSDHGQADPDPTREPFVLDDFADLSGMRIVEGGTYVYLHTDDTARAAAIRDAVNARWNCGRALLPQEAPASWRLNGNPRFPDLIVQADLGCTVLSSRSRRGKITHGEHGWPPEAPEMRGIFYVRGPGIPAGLRLPELKVTDVYPLVARVLGLTPPGPVDGSLDWLRKVPGALPN